LLEKIKLINLNRNICSFSDKKEHLVRENLTTYKLIVKQKFAIIKKEKGDNCRRTRRCSDTDYVFRAKKSRLELFQPVETARMFI